MPGLLDQRTDVYSLGVTLYELLALRPAFDGPQRQQLLRRVMEHALNNRREMVHWLLDRGADPAIPDAKVHNTADGWADYAHHADLATYLRSVRDRPVG